MSVKLKKESQKRWPAYGWTGIIFILIFWVLIWSMPGYPGTYSFFPLWFGYILTVNAIIHYRKGNSLFTRNRKAFFGLFFISIPIWWLFELIDIRTNYWEYLGREHFSDLAYFLLASLSFSTVVPAVLSTSELVSSYSWINKFERGPKIPKTKTITILFFVLGWLMLIALLIWPQYFPAFMWMSLYLIIDPVNVWKKNHNLLMYTDQKDWRPVMSLWIGTLICGFFWEMWNYYAFPKWIYTIPFIDFWHIFEMPLPGYLGYLPFGLEIFAFYHLIIGLVKKPHLRNYISLSS